MLQLYLRYQCLAYQPPASLLCLRVNTVYHSLIVKGFVLFTIFVFARFLFIGWQTRELLHLCLRRLVPHLWDQRLRYTC